MSLQRCTYLLDHFSFERRSSAIWDKKTKQTNKQQNAGKNTEFDISPQKISARDDSLSVSDCLTDTFIPASWKTDIT